MALTIDQIGEKVEVLAQRHAVRDNRMKEITAVRNGDMESVYPDMFPEGMSKPMIANFVDVAARDIAEVLAPLPSFNCSTTNANSDKAKKAAEKRSMIANNYIHFSRLGTQMYTGADWYNTYAFLPFVIEPDFEARMPRIRVENPMGAYPEFDRYGKCVSYSKKYLKSVRELVTEFPEYATRILGRDGSSTNQNSLLELVRYEDKDQIVLFLPQRDNLALRVMANPMGAVSVVIARRPGIDPDNPRGQFDDVLWVQIARARFALLAMEAAEKSVQAPLALPMDVQELTYGPDAVLRSQNPQAIRRVGLEMSPAAFQEQQILEGEMRLGSRYPEGRSGNIDASVITGSGVQALLGGFDTQIKSGQMILSEAFEQVVNLCFTMDEKLFPGKKSQMGTFQGAPYVLEYDPVKDIAGDIHVQVRYGLMAGLDPSRALIFSLQALQANLVSKQFIMSELPWSMNVSVEQERVDIERMRDNLSNAIASAATAIPNMATQGQDPSEVIMKIAKTIEERLKGTPIEEAVAKAFIKEPEPAPTPQAMPALTPAAAPGMDLAQAQPTQQPQASPQTPAPDIATMLAQMGGM